MKKNIKIKLLILLVIITIMGGCTKYLKNAEGKAVVNPKTGQNLTKNIICKPTNKESIELYNKNKVNLDNLPKCSQFNPIKTKYEGLWTNIFVKPLSWLIIKLGSIFKNYGLGLVLATILIKLLLIPITKKSQDQTKAIQEMQPEIKKIEKKYEGKNDSESITKKGTEMAMLYQKYNINPLASMITPIFQVMILFAFLEAIQRVPAIFEGRLLFFEMGITPLTAIKHGSYYYILLTIINMGVTYLSFKTMPGSSGFGSGKSITNIMIILIGFTSIVMPSALNVYWIISSLMVFLQTKLLTKMEKR